VVVWAKWPGSTAKTDGRQISAGSSFVPDPAAIANRKPSLVVRQTIKSDIDRTKVETGSNCVFAFSKWRSQVTTYMVGLSGHQVPMPCVESRAWW
jgi:hypothetical protein